MSKRVTIKAKHQQQNHNNNHKRRKCRTDMYSSNKKTKKQIGGYKVYTLDNIDYDSLKISERVKIDWKGCPEGPPTDCVIL